MRKKIIGFCVSVALVVVALILPVRTTAVVGVGDQRAEAFASLDELAGFFSSMNEDGEENTKTRKKQEYDSFQLSEETKIDMWNESSSSDSDSHSSSNSKANLTRTLTISKTESATLYESVGRFISSSKTNVNASSHYDSSTKSSLDFHIFLFIEDETVLLRIERLQYTYHYKYTDYKESDNNKEETETDDGKEFTVLGSYLNQWINCTSYPEIAYNFLSIDQGNMDFLSGTGELLQKEVNGETSDFKRDGSLYTLKDKQLHEFFGVPEEDKDAKKSTFEGFYEVDLKNRVSPDIRMQMFYDAAYSESKEGLRRSSNGYSFINDSISIRNVNNTVVKNRPIAKLMIEDLIDEIEAEEE